MDLIQAAIIYLSCGTPLGVYLYLDRRESGPAGIYKALVVTLFWFVYLPLLSHRLVTKKLSASLSSNEGASLPASAHEVRICSRSIEAFAERNGRGPGIYEIRAAVERFAGISLLLKEDAPEASDDLSGIARVSGHPDPGLAAAIFRRRNRAALERHRSGAHNELLEIRKQLCNGHWREQEIEDAFSQLMLICGSGNRAGSVAVEQNGRKGEFLSQNSRPRAVRPRWSNSAEPKPRQGLPIRLKRTALTSSLRNDD